MLQPWGKCHSKPQYDIALIRVLVFKKNLTSVDEDVQIL